VALEQKNSSKECLYFPSGKCKNGDRCPFAHVQPQAPPPITISSEFNEDDNWSPEEAQKAKIDKPCKFFNSTFGYCRNGPDCFYLHSQTDISSGASGPQSTVEADNEVDWSSGHENKEYASAWGQVQGWGKHDRLACVPGNAQEVGQEGDQVVNEWTMPQDTSSWDAATAQETPKSDWENRSNQASGAFWQRSKNKPCFRFSEGTCHLGTSCKYSHDIEPRNGFGYRSATLNTQAMEADDDRSSTSGRPAMTPDFAETRDFEPWEKSKTEGSSFVQPQTSNDDGGGDGWNAIWAPATEPTDLSPVETKEYCRAHGQGYCSNGDACRFRHADPDALSAPFSQQVSL
jgi:hypothetical protein